MRFENIGVNSRTSQEVHGPPSEGLGGHTNLGFLEGDEEGGSRRIQILDLQLVNVENVR